MTFLIEEKQISCVFACMKHHPLVAYYQQKQSALQTQLAQLHEQPTMEAIHQFRVAVKKMRAVLGLVERVSEGVYNPKPHLGLIRPPFKAMGPTREAQVNLELLSKMDQAILHGFQEHLKQQVTEGMNIIPMVLADFDTEKLKRLDAHLIQGMQGFSRELVEAEATLFIQQKLQKANQLIPKIEDKKFLHKIRVLLKQVHEILVLLQTLAPDKEYESLRAPIAELNTQLGDWHDLSVFLETLIHYQTTLSPEDGAVLDEFRNQLALQNENIRAEIEEKLVEALN